MIRTQFTPSHLQFVEFIPPEFDVSIWASHNRIEILGVGPTLGFRFGGQCDNLRFG